MDFATEFLHNSLFASGLALLWFGLPGVLVMRLLGLSKNYHSLHAWLVAPALGLCTFGAFSLIVTSVLNLNLFSLGLSWLGFCVGIIFWQRYRPEAEPAPPAWSLAPWHSLALLAFAALWAVFPTLNIYPSVYQDALFVNVHIFDHAKIALVDSIAREGMLPVNPYYAPEGERILLIYYYIWHFFAAQLKLIGGVTGWQAEVAMNGFTAFATLSFLMALAALSSQRRALAAWLVLLFALLGPPADLLMTLLSQGLHDWVGYPKVNGGQVHGLEVLWLQAAWVPQHVLAALSIVVLLFFISRVLLYPRMQLGYAVMAGLTAATGFGASTWVGGIALGVSLPVLAGAALALRLPWRQYGYALQTAIVAVIVCIVAAIPLFISQASGPSLTESQLPFGLGLYPSTSLYDINTRSGYVIHVILFWLQFLPLNLGVGYVLAMLTLGLRKAITPEARNFRYLSIGAVIAFLLIVQFLQSQFWNNSFGWRTVLVPVMLFLVWAAVGLADLLDGQFAQKPHWRLHRWLTRGQLALVSLVMMGVMLGLLGTLRIFQLPDPINPPRSAEELAARQGFLHQREAWAKVREYVAEDELVQANPDGYLLLTPWPATLPYALFADRSTAYANVEYSTVFAYRYDAEQNRATYALMQNVFSATPQAESLQRLRDVFKVKAILVDQFDPVWHSNAIEQSGIYQLAHGEETFKIYLAVQ